MSQARSFTIELTQVGTGKKATVKVNQGGFTPEYTFKWQYHTDTDTWDESFTNDYHSKYTIAIISKKSTPNATISSIPIGFDAISNNDSIIKDINVSQTTLSFAVSANPTYSTRSATITLTQKESGKKLTLTITQAAKADDGVFKADPTALSFGASSDTKSSKITSTSKGQTVGWTVTNKSSMPSWLTVSGEGTGTLSANVKDNA